MATTPAEPGPSAHAASPAAASNIGSHPLRGVKGVAHSDVAATNWAGHESWRFWHQIAISGTKQHNLSVLEGMPPLLTIEEVAEVLRVSKRSAYRLVTETGGPEKMRAIRIGRLLRVERTELERYLSGRIEVQRTFPWT